MQNGAQQQTGTIKWFDRKKGIGFASPAEGGDDIFVHQANLWTDSEGKPPFLDEGVAICYDVSQREGRPIAVNVKLPPGAVSRQPAGGRAAQVSQRDAASALGTLTVSESQPKKRGVVAKAEAPAAAPGGDEAEKKRLKEQAERKQKNRAEHKEKGIDRPTLEKKNKELEANLAGLKAANPDVTRLHEQLQQKTAALAATEELQQAGAVRTAAGLKLLKVVAEAELGHRVDVAKFKLPSGSKVVVEKPKGQDHQLCFKFTEPPISATVNVFTNGKLVVLSAPSEVAASQAVHLTAGLLGSTASAEQLVSSFRVLTRQAQYASPQRIMLAKLLSTLKRQGYACSLEAELHPGLIIRVVPGLSMVGMVVYETGKMRVTGRHSASFDDMVACFQRVFGLVEWRPPEEKAAPAPTAPKPEAAPKPGLPTEETLQPTPAQPAKPFSWADRAARAAAPPPAAAPPATTQKAAAARPAGSSGAAAETEAEIAAALSELDDKFWDAAPPAVEKGNSSEHPSKSQRKSPPAQ